jgi:hypothetical protein
LEQWITIKGVRLKPVILFLHGGPGSVFSPYSDNLYKGLEKDFVVVNWDQRGAAGIQGEHDLLTSKEKTTIYFNVGGSSW